MVIHFSKRFPTERQEAIRALVEKAAAWWGFSDYEIEINLKVPKDALAEVVVVPESHRAIVSLNRHRLSDALLERDLLHELLHIPHWPATEARDSVLAFVPSSKRRAAARALDKFLELSHDKEALAWHVAFSCLPSSPPAGF